MTRIAAGAPGPGARLIDRPGLRLPFIAATLFFTVYPLISLLSHESRPGVLALLLAGWALFALLLVRLFRGGSYVHTVERPWITVAALVILAIAVIGEVVFGVGDAGALFFYAGVTASRIAPERRALAWIGLVALAAAASTGVAASDLGVGLDVGVTVGTISLTIFALSALGRTNRALQAARQELADLAVSEERNRIARDLHDTLGHSLSVIALKSELARRLLPVDAGRADAEMADVERVARDALASVRETVSGYRQPSLAIELAGARAVLAAAGIVGEVEPPAEDLPRDVDAMLGWAVREGVTNVLRHSGASRARIRVLSEDATRSVEVVDDGPGAAPAGEASPVGRPGIGLTGLRERAARMGGRVEAGPLPDRGFRLLVTVPTPAETGS